MAGKPSILLFGGTFDPVHHGHLIVCLSVAEQLGVDRVVLIPAGQPPHKSGEPRSGAHHRLRMAQLGVEGDVLFDVSACEMERTGPSYTLDTVRQFRSTYGPQASLYWLIGGDSLAELATWHEPRQLVDECTIVTAVRRGHDLGDLRQLEKTLTSEQIARLKEYALDTPRIDVSATEIRRRVRAGRSIRYLVPRAVERYILAQGLYLKSE